LIDAEVQQSLTQPMPRLDSGSLLVGGISMMHRSSRRDFDRARQALEALLERHNRAATPRAWLAKWYIMRVVRGMSESPARDSKLAIEQTERALDLEPSSALALAIQGHALCQLSSDVQGALSKIEQSVRLNPNESLAWLYKSVWSSMWGSASESIDQASLASRLSPIDPLRHYHDCILASAYAMNQQYRKAIEIATRSIKANKHHQPTLRVLLHAQASIGQLDEARSTLGRLFEENPSFTVSSYLAIGGADSSSRRAVAQVLRTLGVREH
jgi:tetratricopeptide (TPR) repeat protein